MIARFFIDRPIFATVLSVVITLAGAMAVGSLPVSQYPKVTPPTIQIDCNYPGASAQVVSETIASPIEQQVNGVEDMLYMTSQCTSDGTYTLTVTFKSGTDLNMAQVRVQNRVNLAFPQLPEVVRATGITTRKRSPELLMTVGITSPPEPGLPEGRYDQLYLSNYAVLKLKEELQRLPGISDVTIFGQRDYAMRLWVDPDKLAARNLTAADVILALRQQNLPIAAGQVGQPPNGSGQPYQFTLTALGRLEDVEQFEQIVVKAGPQGQLVKVKDIARVELGAKSHDVANRFDDKATVGLAIFILPEANAIETAEAVKGHMAKMGTDFPPGITYEIGYDTSPFIRESIFEVFKSLRDAIVLVAIVVLVFLQTWRAAFIPLAAVPVAIIGTFGAMALAGFTINNLTLFGLVLAVGIVVDDAIVVVEAVQHQLEKGFTPREATLRAMEDVSGPIIAVGVVLGAVFLPCAFLSGIVGAFFRQFALTIAVSTLISTFNSLTLSPALCALLLKGPPDPTRKRSIFAVLMGYAFFPLTYLGQLFNRVFATVNRGYVKLVSLGLRVPLLVLAGYGAIVASGMAAFRTQPTGFIPQQDKGYMICSVQLPDAASAERTREVMSKISRIALETELDDGTGNKVRPVRHVNAVAGNSFVISAYGSNFGSMFVILDDFENRRSKTLTADAIAIELRKRFNMLCPEGQVQVFGAPAVSGLGRAGGFRIMIEDRGDVGPAMLQQQTEAFIDKANQQKQVVGLFTVFKTNSPQLVLSINVDACLQRQVDVGDVYAALQGTMGSRYANDFNRFGRTWQVNVQADDRFRDQLEDVKRLKVRNKKGDMVPLGALLTVNERSGPLVITRYNMYPAAAVNGNVSAGSSTGDAIGMLEKLAEQQLPDKMAYEWTELTFLEKQSRNTGGLVFGLSVAFVFLILSALYESWAFPLAVILVVPVCVACSLGAVWLSDPGSATQQVLQWNAGDGPEFLKLGPWALGAAGWTDRVLIGNANKWVLASGIGKQDVNIFTQVGFVVLVGLACKNAILIVEFAKIARDKGADLNAAILEACALRFRPIMMTSVAFMLGVVPLAIAKGAGAEMRQALGVAVLGGMLGVTAFGVFLTPVFFALMDRLVRRTRRLTGHSRVMSLAELALVLVAIPGMLLAIEFGSEALLYEILFGFVGLLLAVFLGMLVIATGDTVGTLGGAVQGASRIVLAVPTRTARRLGDVVRKIRARGGTK
ncbi:efflux RND transporter permease subunit [Gemmata sp. G18]|uniref:Efflux RND transporter permease subunit n=1 Tax=Gemmata palustris TaxID=2822762 RepID=A0ABS5BWI7_9BACT|nr:efflux RND transporter permease subunit [Gemmata palustris]MBP3958104.1 efflux RND transporter permease subunit [Gemmata palustris]